MLRVLFPYCSVANIAGCANRRESTHYFLRDSIAHARRVWPRLFSQSHARAHTIDLEEQKPRTRTAQQQRLRATAAGHCRWMAAGEDAVV